MKIFVGLFLVVTLLLTGCSNNETFSIEGKVSDVNYANNTFVVYVGDTLTKEEKQNMEYGEDAVFEAYMIKADKNRG